MATSMRVPFPLLERTAKSVRLTDAGRTFLEEARAVVQLSQQAVRNAVTKAQKTLRNIDWFEVGPIRGAVHKSGALEFQVEVRIGFRLEGESR